MSNERPIKPMPPVGGALARIEARLATVTIVPDATVCPLCFDTGMEVTPAGARHCKCQKKVPVDHVALLLAKIPKRYAGVSLASLEPDSNLHPEQVPAVAYMKAHPQANYFLCGEPDAGKSHLFWALYEAAVRAERDVIATTLYKFLEEIKAGFSDQHGLRMVNVLKDLEDPWRRYSIFLDDVDKARPTDFAGETFHNFIDAVYNHKHQLVVTSQLDPEKAMKGRMSLTQHFETVNPTYGHAIVRRMYHDETAIFRFFGKAK